MPFAVQDEGPGDGMLGVRSVEPDRWDSLVSGFEDVIQEQLHRFNEVRRSNDSLRHLVVYGGDRVIGAALLRRASVPMTGMDIFSLRWGPLWRPADDGRRAMSPEAVYRALVADVVEKQGAALVVMPRPDPDHQDVDITALKTVGFGKAGPLPNPARYFVNTHIPLEDIRKSLSQKWRYNLKKASKEGLETVEVEGAAALDQVLSLYHEMVERKGLVDYAPIDTLAHRLKTPDSAVRPRVFVTRKDGASVAMAVVDTCGDTASYLYGATGAAALPLRAGYALQWAVIEHLAADPSVRWYGLGGGGESESCALHQFKRGLTGKAGRIVAEAPPHFIARGQYATALVKLAINGRDMRNRMRESLGQLFALKIGR